MKKNIILRRIKLSAVDMPPNYEYQIQTNQQAQFQNPQDIVNDVMKNADKIKQNNNNVDLSNYKIMKELTNHKHNKMEECANKVSRWWEKTIKKDKQNTFEIKAFICNAIKTQDEANEIVEAFIHQIDDIFGKTDMDVKANAVKNDEGLFDIEYSIAGACSSKMSKDDIEKALTFGNIAEVQNINITTSEGTYHKKDTENKHSKKHDITNEKMDHETRLMAICKYIGNKTGINPLFIMAQKLHEVGRQGSDLSDRHNWGGLKAEGNYKTDEKGHTYFDTDKEYADTWIEQIANHYPGLKQAKTIDEYLQILNKNGYFEDDPAAYFKDTKELYNELV